MLKGYMSVCPYCHDRNYVRKHGKARSGLQRYYCSECQRTFQTKYIYQIDKESRKGIKSVPATADIS